MKLVAVWIHVLFPKAMQLCATWLYVVYIFLNHICLTLVDCFMNITAIRGEASTWPECECLQPCNETKYVVSWSKTVFKTTVRYAIRWLNKMNFSQQSAILITKLLLLIVRRSIKMYMQCLTLMFLFMGITCSLKHRNIQ
jgi:hypothetical protein